MNEEQVVELYRQGVSTAVIAKQLGVRRQKIYAIALAAGLKTRGRGRPGIESSDPDRAAELRMLYSSGKMTTIKAAAETIGVPYHVARHLIHKEHRKNTPVDPGTKNRITLAG